MSPTMDPTHLVQPVIAAIRAAPPADLLAARAGAGLRVALVGGHAVVESGCCVVRREGVEMIVTAPAALAAVHGALEERLGRSPFAPRARDRAAVRSVPGVRGAEDVPAVELERRVGALLRGAYPHDEIFGGFCFLGEHVATSWRDAVAYCADVPALAEWTLNVRNLVPVGGGLYRGQMVFSPEDAAAPATDIFIRAEVLEGPQHALVCYPCAWDQGDDLWMRYYFVVADAERTLGRPGAVVMWVNARHRYYDRDADPVPAYVAAGRARTDRPWAGDGWPLFHPLHRLELDNLKRILEHRHPLP